MHYMVQPLSFRWDPEFVAAIDAARGDVSRSLWVRRAVEQALGEVNESGGVGPCRPLERAQASSAPAERPDALPNRALTAEDVRRHRPSAESKRGVAPVPKGKR